MSEINPYALLDHIREAAGQRLVEVVAAVLPRIADEFRASVDAGHDLRSEMALCEAALVLGDEIEIRAESATGSLDEHYFRALQEKGAATDPKGASGYQLLPETTLTERIVAQNLATRAREAMDEAYPAYLSRLSQLTGTPIGHEEAGCPLGVRALSEALVTAIRPYVHHPLTRVPVELALQKHAVVPIREIIARADRMMVERGILATLPRIVVFPGLRKAVEGGAALNDRSEPKVVEQTLGSKSEAALESKPEAKPESKPESKLEPKLEPKPIEETAADAARQIVRTVKATADLGANPLVARQDRRLPFRQAELLPRIDSLERDAIAFAHQVGQSPFSSAARQAFFGQLRGQMAASGVDPAQLATVDLVAAMFDYATDSERIPDPAKPLLWRLQLPAVTLACLDAGFVGDESRSIRRLVEHVAAIATAYPDEFARGSELHGRLQTVVRAVEVVAHAFQVRSQVLSEQVAVEYKRATYGMGQLLSKVTRERRELEANAGRRNRRDYRKRPSREREIEVGGHIERMLNERLQDREVPETVSEFLNGVWLRHLRTAILRDGEESPSYQAALQVVDDLLWTLDGHGERRSRTELAHRIPEMLKILTQGINDIGAKAEDFRAFFDEMFLIHLRRMQKRRKPAKKRPANSKPAAVDPPAEGDSGRTRGIVNLEPEQTAAATSEPNDDLPLLVDPIAGAASAREPTPRSAAVIEPPASAPDAVTNGVSEALTPVPVEPDAQVASELKLRRLIDETSLDDAPKQPVRMNLTAAELGQNLAPGQWLEMISSSRRRILAKVAWMNERRSVVLLLQHPDRLILSRHVSALIDRAERRRAFRVR